MTDQTFWKKCSTCKKEIPFSTMYYRCSVSTCQHKRKGFSFCSVQCWDAHLGFARHREAWAEERTAPSQEQHAAATPVDKTRAPVRKIMSANVDGEVPPRAKNISAQSETLVVVTKVKKVVKELSGFSTSQCCIDALSQKVVEECKKGIEKAKKVDRKTVMGRDIR
ncbi:hypothetical protein OAO01_09045 [Oligoflexia bacterium]|nr:hypothetical protein [Oligoflexia bacterium]